jgi:Chromo (CHRromatin Organisation MOdifier) domain
MLALAEFTHNDKTSSSTSMSPFYVNTGMHPWKGIENAVESRNESADDFAKKMKKIRDEAAAALEKTQKNMKKYYDMHRREVPEFKVGDKVWLEAKDITTDRLTKKLDDRRLGPYEILEKVGASAYKLKLPETDKSHPVYNEALLTPYDEPPAHRREERPGPQIVQGQEEYEVEEILKHRKRGRGYQYLVKWKNYPTGERTWEPTRHLTNAKELLDRYNVEHNIAVRSLPVLPLGYWDGEIHRYITKEEK